MELEKFTILDVVLEAAETNFVGNFGDRFMRDKFRKLYAIRQVRWVSLQIIVHTLDKNLL